MSEQELESYQAEVQAVKDWWKVRPLSLHPYLSLTTSQHVLTSIPHSRCYPVAPPVLPRQAQLHRRRGRQQTRHLADRLPFQQHGQEDVVLARE